VGKKWQRYRPPRRIPVRRSIKVIRVGAYLPATAETLHDMMLVLDSAVFGRAVVVRRTAVGGAVRYARGFSAAIA
jgi:hypothetical protein